MSADLTVHPEIERYIDAMWMEKGLSDNSLSSYRRDLRALLEAKLQGGELPPPSEAEAPKAPAVDLLEALKASVEAAKVGRNASPTSPTRKKAPAKPRARSKS